MSGDTLIQQFEAGTTAAETFHHADHVRLAFEFLRRYSILEALLRYSGALQRFAAAQGKAERYHETVTWAYIFLIRERMVRDGGAQTWEEFSRDNTDLLVWRGGALANLYRQETLDSDLARQIFLLPDRGCNLNRETLGGSRGSIKL